MSDEEREECDFVKRMIEKAYSDKKFEDPRVIRDLSLCVRLVNRPAATLVVSAIAKLIDRILEVANQILTSSQEPNSAGQVLGLTSLGVKKLYA